MDFTMDKMFSISILFFTACVALTSGNNDPCDPVNHNELNEPHRSTGYHTGVQETPICDIHLQPGWYRFTSLSGGMMPTKCPSRLSCGTVVPIWMNGTHPSVGDGTVARTACGNFHTGGPQTTHCCEHSLGIGVKNCGPFYVYYLMQTPSCPMAYCAGSKSPCPIGKWSPTAFPPCKDAFPLLTTAPTLSDPLIFNNNSFRFVCRIHWPTHDPDQRFEVIWTFDDHEDPNVQPQILADPQRAAVLDGAKLRGHIGSNVGCKVRSYYQVNGSQSHKSGFLKSNVYNAGIRVGPASLLVSEKSFSKNVTTTSTIPILCDHHTECCLVFKLDVNSKTDLSVPTTCDYKMCSSDWDPRTRTASIQVPVVAKQDLIDDGDKQLLLAFEKLLPSGGGPYLEVFNNHTPPKVQVEVEDHHTFSCSITGDPHVHGHDFQSYHLYKVGDFTAYEVPARDFQVQIRTWPCNGGKVTCICGVAIREKNDVIRVDQCDQPYAGPTTSPTVSTAHKLSDATIVQRSKNGRHIGVYLPSGSEVKIDTSPKAMNLYITSPPFDKARARGICGTNDGVRANEFTHPDGTVDAMCASGTRSHCIPNAFMESWRSSPRNSLFENVPNFVNDTLDIKYCQCQSNTQAGSAALCNSRGNVAPTNTACPRCPPITNTLVPSFLVGKGWNKRDVLYADVDVPTHPYVQKDIPEVKPGSLQWPNIQGVTESQARSRCETAIHKSPLWSKCQSMTGFISSLMEDCLMDVLYGGSFDFLDDITSHFTAFCQLTLSRDPSNYVTDYHGDVIMKPELLTDVCFPECEEHGHCGAHGVCHCNAGWEGEMCHLIANQGPKIVSSNAGMVCDTQTRPCRKVFIEVTNLDLSDDLTCKVQIIDENAHPIGKPHVTEAQYLTAGKMSCALPKTDAAMQTHEVMASNDGKLFGNAIIVRVLDSNCFHCTGSTCTRKNTACKIDNKCYVDGAKNPIDVTKVCDVSKDVNQWTVVPAAMLPSTPSVSGPNADFQYECTFDPTLVSGNVKVTWFVDGLATSAQMLAKGEGTAFFSNLPKNATLSCRIELNGKSSTSTSIKL